MGTDAFDPVAPPGLLANVGPYLVTSTGSTYARKLNDRFADTINVKDFGAVGDGVADDTAAIQAATTAAAAIRGAVLVFPFTAAGYKMGLITVPSATALTLRGVRTRLNLLGNSAGFSFPSPNTYTGITVEGFDATGDGVVASAQAFVNFVSSVASDVKIRDNRVQDVMTGIVVFSSSGAGFDGVLVTGNYVKHSVGGTPGQGYGITVSSAQTTPINAVISENVVSGCQRHGIYVSQARGVIVSRNHVINHRDTLAGGDTHGVQRPAISIGRGADILVTGNVIEGARDGAMDVFSDSAGTTVDTVTVSENVIRNWYSYPALSVGLTSPSTNGSPTNVTIARNVFSNDIAVTGGTGVAASALMLQAGKRITFEGNTVEILGATDNPAALLAYADGEGAGTATYSDNWRFLRNTVRSTGASPAYVYRIDAVAAASGVQMDFAGLRNIGTSPTFFFSGPQTTGKHTVFDQAFDGFDLSKAKALTPGPKSGVTAAIATGATVTHGLGVTPTSVVLTAADGTPTAVFPSALGATTFTINYTGGGTHAFYWHAEY